jgi:prephenate dehydratase
MRLGVSGEPGSFSEQAGFIYAEKININKSEFNYLTDMENVLSAVEKSRVDIGIFPVVNFRGGLVKMAFEAMGRHKFQMIDEVILEVRHCLMAKAGVKITQIAKIVSHQQAIIQCQEYIKNKFKNIEIVDWEDTAKAARDLSENRLSIDTAVIAPAISANLYHLNILAENIQDDISNRTIFIVVRKRV